MYNRQTKDIDITIGYKIRELRRSKKVNQEELASRIGITYQQIQKYERAKNRISISRLVDICKALDICIIKFMEGVVKC